MKEENKKTKGKKDLDKPTDKKANDTDKKDEKKAKSEKVEQDVKVEVFEKNKEVAKKSKKDKTKGEKKINQVVADTKSNDDKKIRITSVVKVFLLALFCVVLTIAGKYCVDVFSSAINTTSTSSTIYEWNFVWGETQEELEGDIAAWKLATSERRVKKLSNSNDYLRMNHTLAALDEGRTLVIETNNCPVKVELNGDEIYNNGYGQSKFVGSTHNEIDIPADSSEQVIDVFAYSQTPITIETKLVKQAKDFTAYLDYAGMLVAIAIIVAGIVMSFVSLLISLNNTNLPRMILLGATTSVAGIAMLINQATANTRHLTSPVFYNIQLIADIITIGMIILCCFVSSKSTKSRGTIVSLTAVTLSSIALAFISNALLLKGAVLAYVAVLLIYAIVTFMNFVDRIQYSLKYSLVTATAFIYIVVIGAYNIVTCVLGYQITSRVLLAIAVVIFGVILYYVFFKQSINSIVRKKEREQYNIENNKWNEKVDSVYAELLNKKDNNSFINASSEFIVNTVSEYVKSQAEYSLEASEKLKEGIRASAVYIDGETTETIYSTGDIGECDYTGLIMDYKSTDRKVVIANSNISMLVTVDNRVKIIYHVENIVNGLTAEFKNLMTSIHSAIELIYNNYVLKTQMTMSQEKIFLALAETVEAVSHGTKAHLYAVKGITKIICEELGFSKEETKLVSSAAAAHDVGKIAISEKILQKPTELTPKEMDVMRRHVIFGYNILSQAEGEFMDAAAVIAYQHHERYDGSGYLRFKGKQIHIYARIVAVADVIDALLSTRTYKEPWTPEKVEKYLKEHSGTEFDPDIIKVVIRRYKDIVKVRTNSYINN